MQNFTCSALLRCRLAQTSVFGYGAFTLCGRLFQAVLLTSVFTLLAVLQPRNMHCYTCGLGCCAFARHYLRNHFCFLFLRVLRCFSSPGLPLALQDVTVACDGLPHSEIRGSMGICPSPRLIAACHVLLRLREPRHPSCALLSFPFFFGKVAFVIDIFFAAVDSPGLRLAPREIVFCFDFAYLFLF